MESTISYFTKKMGTLYITVLVELERPHQPLQGTDALKCGYQVTVELRPSPKALREKQYRFIPLGSGKEGFASKPVVVCFLKHIETLEIVFCIKAVRHYDPL